jgi:hypothetical protein
MVAADRQGLTRDVPACGSRVEERHVRDVVCLRLRRRETGATNGTIASSAKDLRVLITAGARDGTRCPVRQRCSLCVVPGAAQAPPWCHFCLELPLLAALSLSKRRHTVRSELLSPATVLDSAVATRSSRILASGRQDFAMRAAHRTASSRDGTSSTAKPPFSVGAHG